MSIYALERLGDQSKGLAICALHVKEVYLVVVCIAVLGSRNSYGMGLSAHFFLCVMVSQDDILNIQNSV